jgi:hypothetical protein
MLKYVIRKTEVLKAWLESSYNESEYVHKTKFLREISSSHGGGYDVQNCILGYTAVLNYFRHTIDM